MRDLTPRGARDPRPTPGDEQGPEAQFSGLARPGSCRAVTGLGRVTVWFWGPRGERSPPCLRARFEEGNPFASQPSLPRLKTAGERLLSLLPEALGRGLLPRGGEAGGWNPFADTAPHAAGGSSCHRDRCRRTQRQAWEGHSAIVHPHPAPTAGPGLQPQAGPSVSIPGPEGQAGLERLVDVC